jgi:hypothetical protein
MADINRGSVNGDLVKEVPELWKKQLQVLLNEKENQLKQLDVHLDHLRTVEIKRIELKQGILLKEIEQLKIDVAKAGAI